ncbi:MAG TPA: hypothetical protein VJ904_01595 [Tichowtungia sp.]|nr:hypothetical protein [Tichowtungia sp.]
MAKKAIYYDEAKRLFVTQGMALTAIEGMLDGNVSRRQLHNWKTDGRWEDKRKRYLEENESLQKMVMEIAKTAARNALENPTPKNMLALSRAISALNQRDALALFASPEQEKPSDKEDLTQTILQAIKEELGA